MCEEHKYGLADARLAEWLFMAALFDLFLFSLGVLAVLVLGFLFRRFRK
jgi:hypothetical protein